MCIVTVTDSDRLEPEPEEGKDEEEKAATGETETVHEIIARDNIHEDDVTQSSLQSLYTQVMLHCVSTLCVVDKIQISRLLKFLFQKHFE